MSATARHAPSGAPGHGSTPAGAAGIDASPWIDAKASQRAGRAARARHASTRRRLVDPATCERDYAPDEIEFMSAMQAYKAKSGRLFPTRGEVLEVLLGLGYEKPAVPRQP